MIMGDSENANRCSSPIDSIIINDTVNNENKSDDDDRIDCTSSYYLDKIYEVAVRHVTELAESHLKEDKQQFVAKFSEVFKNFFEQNVTVKGLPWIINEEKLTSNKKQEQTQETIDALLSELSKTLEKTAEKRKLVPRNCCRIYSMQSKYERQNLKRARIESPVTLPSVSTSTPLIDSQDQCDSQEVLLAVGQSIESMQQKIEEQAEKLVLIQKRVDFANKVARQHKTHSETLYDTGYISD